MSNRWRPFKLKFSAILLPTFWTNRIPRNIYVSLPFWSKSDKSSRIKMSRDKTNQMSVCTQRRLRSALASRRTAKTLNRLGECPGWSEPSLGIYSLCCFCHIAAQITHHGSPVFSGILALQLPLYSCYNNSLHMSHVMRLWFFLSSVNSCFKRAWSAIQ